MIPFCLFVRSFSADLTKILKIFEVLAYVAPKKFIFIQFRTFECCDGSILDGSIFAEKLSVGSPVIEIDKHTVEHTTVLSPVLPLASFRGLWMIRMISQMEKSMPTFLTHSDALGSKIRGKRI